VLTKYVGPFQIKSRLTAWFEMVSSSLTSWMLPQRALRHNVL
jgi:hypothetical protein